MSKLSCSKEGIFWRLCERIIEWSRTTQRLEIEDCEDDYNSEALDQEVDDKTRMRGSIERT